MIYFLEQVRKYLRRDTAGQDGKLPFKVVFSRFRQVLDGNNHCLEIMADMGDKLSGDYIFDVKYIRSVYTELADTLFKSIYNLNALARNRYLRLHEIYEKTNSQINRILDGKSPSGLTEPVLFFGDIYWETADEVGGKIAGIAELYNYMKINVPWGFAVTMSAFRMFVEHNRIDDRIREIRQKYRKAQRRIPQEDIMSAIAFAEAGEHETARDIIREDDGPDEDCLNEIRELFIRGEMPPMVREAVAAALDRLRTECGDKCFLAVRSSAEEEDGDFSFAGQFKTVLNVPADIRHVEKAYKEVLASLYSPRAVAYKKQIMPEDGIINMGVGCVVMAKAEMSGVMYSSDPADLENDAVVINANFGLGTTVVDGSVDADHYLVERDDTHNIIDKRIGKKEKACIRAEDGGVREIQVSQDRRGT
ncbi:MAG: PEP/pyruvate-binding domain-containing protein, partial [Nitrospirota bacterium]